MLGAAEESEGHGSIDHHAPGEALPQPGREGAAMTGYLSVYLRFAGFVVPKTTGSCSHRNCYSRGFPENPVQIAWSSSTPS